MFTWLATQWTNLQLRAQLAWTRVPQAWQWFTTQVRDVQIAVILDLLVMFIAIVLSVWFESNKPARYALVPVVLFWMYITRKLVLPVWFGELGFKAANKVVEWVDAALNAVRSNLPKWMVWVVGQPDKTQHPVAVVHHNGNHPALHPDAIWHDTSYGGHIFHVLSTVWMWTHVLLLACGVFPIWEKDWLSAIVMLTAFILFFVATEDYVNIKTWRRRLAYALTLIAIWQLGPMTLRTIMPGTYNNIMARVEYREGLQQTEAEGIAAQAEEDKKELAKLLKQDREFKKRHRDFLDRKAGALWTDQDTQDWAANTKRIEDMKTPEVEESSSETLLTYLHPLYIAGAGILLGVVGLGMLIVKGSEG